MSVHFNGEEIRVRHLPAGHTDGDSVVHFTGSGVVHMGDLFFNGMFPFVDLNSGGSVEGYTRNVGTVLAQVPEGAKIIPGHGPIAGKEDLARFHQMLVETTGFIRKALDAGQNLEQIKAGGLPDAWKDWGRGFISTDRWIETVVKSLGTR